MGNIGSRVAQIQRVDDDLRGAAYDSKLLDLQILRQYSSVPSVSRMT